MSTAQNHPPLDAQLVEMSDAALARIASRCEPSNMALSSVALLIEGGKLVDVSIAPLDDVQLDLLLTLATTPLRFDHNQWTLQTMIEKRHALIVSVRHGVGLYRTMQLHRKHDDAFTALQIVERADDSKTTNLYRAVALHTWLTSCLWRAIDAVRVRPLARVAP